MKTIKIIFTNGFFPLALILLFNIILVSQLPPAFEPVSFNTGIPTFISINESIFRIISVTIPLFVRMNNHTKNGQLGIRVLIIGIIIYFSSWGMQIFVPTSLWSQSVWGFTAPAYTALIWTLGLILVFDSYYFKLPFKKWHYAVPALIFLFFHIWHAILVFNRL